MADQCTDYRIGTTLATLKDTTWYDIPHPIVSPYVPYGVTRLCGDMTSKGYGFASATWSWSSMSQHQLDALLDWFDEGSDTADVYIRTYKDYGSQRIAADFSVKMYRPKDSNGYTLVAGSRFNYTNVSVKFGHLVEI